MPSNVYKELLGCSERRVPRRAVTRWGEVIGEVWGDACLILRFVSLRVVYLGKDEERDERTHPSRFDVSI